jgi:hypothetical protein
MDVITRDELKTLRQVNEDPCISLFMPTNREWDKLDQDVIMFKNHIQKLEKVLKERNMNTREIEKMLKPAFNLIEDREFWNHQTEGLAVFMNRNEFRTYRVPISVKEDLIVSFRYKLKPLLPILSGDGRYYVLCLGKKNIYLYQGSRFSLQEIKLPKDTPESLDQLFEWEDPQADPTLHFHGGSTNQVNVGPSSISKDKSGMFHGHGDNAADATDPKLRVLDFFRLIDKGVCEKIGQENAPLVLAAIDVHIPVYKEANNYSNLHEVALNYNPMEYSVKELHEATWEIVKPLFDRAEKSAREKFNQFLGNGRASNNFREILKNSFSNKIETLFVATSDQKWGKYDLEKDNLRIDEHPSADNEDLVDLIALQALEEGAQVFTMDQLDIPDSESVAAVYRY